MHGLNDAHLADAIAAKQLTRIEHALDAVVRQASGPQNGLVALALGMGVSAMGAATPLIAAAVAGFYGLRMMICSIQSQDEAKRASKLFQHPQVQAIVNKIASNAPASTASQNGTAWLIVEGKSTPNVRVLKKFEYIRHRRSIMSTGHMLDEVSVSSDKIVHRRYIGRNTFTLATHKVKWSRTTQRLAKKWSPVPANAGDALSGVEFASTDPNYRASHFLRGRGTGFKD